MKKLFFIFVFATILASCNNSNISEPINIGDGSGNNVSVSQEGMKVITDSGETINSISTDENGLNITTSGTGGKSSNLQVGNNGINASVGGDKNTGVNVDSSGGVQVDGIDGASTKEVDELLNSIDKMIDNK